MKLKKIISLLLAFIIAFSCCFFASADEEMLNAFCESVEKKKDVQYKVDGLKVTVVW